MSQTANIEGSDVRSCRLEISCGLTELDLRQSSTGCCMTVLEHCGKNHSAPSVGQLLSNSATHSVDSRHIVVLSQFTFSATAQFKASSARCASALQAYARKLGQCLLELATSTDTSRAEAEMQSCTMETHALNLCVAMGNPRSFSKFHSQRLDGLSGADNSHLSDTFYVEMLVWCSLKTASCAAASAYTCYMHHNPIESVWCHQYAVDAKQPCLCQQSHITL